MYNNDVIILIRSLAIKHRTMMYLKEYSKIYCLDTNNIVRLSLSCQQFHRTAFNWRLLSRVRYTHIFNIKDNFVSAVGFLPKNY